ncbi:MAG: right-handed parallel beta-helix repeat-containing protein [Methanotrichaceae archaeon]|nr:right-handed parallel beta-helix repeat-containing protein [Methanotrichaceae archaeon]
MIIIFSCVVTAHSSILKVMMNDGDYPKIQAAINAAKVGDQIEVSEGVYRENILVNKSLNLIALGDVFIDAGGNYLNGPAITLTANNVTIEGFTVMNSTNIPGDPYAGSGIELRSNNSILRNNTLINNYISGIKILKGHNNTIINNTIRDNYEGILIAESDDNDIISNYIIKNSGAGVAFIRGAKNNSISSNEISKNSIGVMSRNSSYNNIGHNNIMDNKQEISNM